MQIQFLGADGTVAGLNYLLTVGAMRRQPLRLRNWAGLPVGPSAIDAFAPNPHIEREPRRTVYAPEHRDSVELE